MRYNSSPRPDATGRLVLRRKILLPLSLVRSEVDRQDATAKPSSGGVTARRVNRADYNNTVRDLLGVDFHPADDFPGMTLVTVSTTSPTLRPGFKEARKHLDEALSRNPALR